MCNLFNHSAKYKCSFYTNEIEHWNNLPRLRKSGRSKYYFKRNLSKHLSDVLYMHWVVFLQEFVILLILFN